jgi:hypothetical protein
MELFTDEFEPDQEKEKGDEVDTESPSEGEINIISVSKGLFITVVMQSLLSANKPSLECAITHIVYTPAGTEPDFKI